MPARTKDLQSAAQPLARPASEHEPSADNDGFARQLGFASYLELFETSTPVASGDARHWFATPVDQGRWVAWNQEERQASSAFDSKERAVRYIHEHSRSPGAEIAGEAAREE